MKHIQIFTIATGALAVTFTLNGFTMVKPNHQHFIMAEMTGSENWAGYIDTANGQPYTDITGSWRVPTVSGLNQSANAQWVGLGGVLSHDLLQMGTLETIQNGQQVDELFWEKLPTAAVPIARVQPGDTVNTEIKYMGGDKWQLIATVSNASQLITKRVNVSVGSNYASQIAQSAEWISEDPSNGQYQIVPMANSGSVTFNDATVNNGPISQADSTTHESVLLDSSNGQTVMPSALSNGGTTFSTIPGSESNNPVDIEVEPGMNVVMPSVSIPLDSTGIARMWQQLSQLEIQMNQLFQQWSSSIPTIPSQSTSWHQQLSSNGNNNANVRTWSGTTNGWHWSVQVFNN